MHAVRLVHACRARPESFTGAVELLAQVVERACDDRERSLGLAL
jgi:hypothetical protein